MKKCFKCEAEKPLSEFYKHPTMGDGHLGKCKECTKRDVAGNYRKNRTHYAEYEKRRYQDPRRRVATLEYQRKKRAKNPDQYKANTAVSNAVRDGRLIKMPCEVCGADKAQAHHDDYLKPLDVRWLCREHHLELHGREAY